MDPDGPLRDGRVSTPNVFAIGGGEVASVLAEVRVGEGGGIHALVSSPPRDDGVPTVD